VITSATISLQMREQNTVIILTSLKLSGTRPKLTRALKAPLQPFAQVHNHHTNSLTRSKYQNNVKYHESDTRTYENYNETLEFQKDNILLIPIKQTPNHTKFCRHVPYEKMESYKVTKPKSDPDRHKVKPWKLRKILNIQIANFHQKYQINLETSESNSGHMPLLEKYKLRHEVKYTKFKLGQLFQIKAS